MKKDLAIKGDWNAFCDVCNFKLKASKLRKRWDGLMVCKEDWEPRHAQDLIKGPVGPESRVPWTRPEKPDRFDDTTFILPDDPIKPGTFTLEDI